MRPRHVVILALLAAVPIALAIGLTGGGGGAVAGGPGLAQVTLKLLGGTDAGVITACGKTHHFQAYSSSASVPFRGAVSPPGGWTVALKLKACIGGSFQSAGEVPAGLSRRGSYSGSFPAPIAGAYEVRTDVRRQGALVTRSQKRYFEVR